MGFTMDPLRAAILLGLMMPILVGLAFYSGFENRVGLLGATVDAFVAYAVGAVVCGIMLNALAVLHWNQAPNEIVGRIILQTLVASFGAVLAASQMGGGTPAEDEGDSETEPSVEEESEVTNQIQACQNSDNSLFGYLREMFFMLAGSLFLALNVAPTEEIIVLAFKMQAGHAVAIVLLSLVIMHAFVYRVKFLGQEETSEEHSVISVFFRFTVPGYAIALLTSLFLLWVFGRLEYTAFDETVMACTVLGLPASVGAASARLIL